MKTNTAESVNKMSLATSYKDSTNTDTYLPGYTYIPIVRNAEEHPIPETNNPRLEHNPQRIACCLTAYNEPFSAYRESIQSLAQSADYFLHQGKSAVANELLICVVIDGLQNMSSEFGDWAQSLGMFDAEVLDPNADIHIFESEIPRHTLLSHLTNGSAGSNVSHIPHANSRGTHQKILLLIKQDNWGKLDSHRCFFESICRMYHPSFFVQIDVGTVPEPPALFRMWEALQENNNFSAIAARSLTAPPKHPFDLLSTWQYCDIAIERTVNWPSEVLAGNLSVLPGQLSMFRMAAIASTDDIESSKTLKNYYRGLGELNLYEANMYLAEDRILGFEMTHQQDKRWELGYATDAVATIDECETWGELLRQRRRWICSYTACRVALISKLPQVFSNRCRSYSEKLHKSFAAFYFLMASIIEWLVPGFHFITQITINNINLTLNHHPLYTGIHQGISALIISSFALQLLLSLKNSLFNKEETVVKLSLYTQIGCLGIGIINILLFSLPVEKSIFFGLLLMTFMAAYLGMARIYSHYLSKHLVKHIAQYTLSRLPVKSFLNIYAVFNFHNTSWGTKGLESSGITNTVSRSKYRQLLSARLPLITLYLGSNIGLIYLFQKLHLLNSLTTLYGLLSVLIFQLSFAFIAALYMRKKQNNNVFD